MESPQAITVEYNQNFNDWHQSLTAAGVLKDSPHRPFTVLALGCFLLAMMTRFFAPDVIMIALLICGGGFGIVALLMGRLVRNRLAKRWAESRSGEMLLQVTFDEEGITVHADRVHSRMKWSTLIRHHETPWLIVCLLGTGNILAIPKARLSLDALSALRDLLIRKKAENAPVTGFPIQIRQDEEEP